MPKSLGPLNFPLPPLAVELVPQALTGSRAGATLEQRALSPITFPLECSVPQALLKRTRPSMEEPIVAVFDGDLTEEEVELLDTQRVHTPSQEIARIRHRHQY